MRAVVASRAVVLGSALLVALFAACAPHLPAPSLSAILSAPAVRCFDSYGIDVRAEDAADCPSPREFGIDAAWVLESARLEEMAFAGVRVVYVRGYVDCSGNESVGCSSGAMRVAVVARDSMQRRTLRHELAHLALAFLERPEYEHDHRSAWWRRIDPDLRRARP